MTPVLTIFITAMAQVRRERFSPSFRGRVLIAGREGAGRVGVTSFSVAPAAIPYWRERLTQHNVPLEQEVTRFGEQVLPFQDPDGMKLDLVAVADDTRAGWNGSDVPVEYSILGFHSATLNEANPESTVQLLRDVMGFRVVGEEAGRLRLQAAPENTTESGVAESGATLVDILTATSAARGSDGAGGVHHIAWRVDDDASQLWWQNEISHIGLGVSPVMDRQYFHSIYFRETGGVLFEIATDPPGFTADESLEQLGTSLKLPPQYESARAQIEAHLPPVKLPAKGGNK
jgi:glyoxalase family protein